MERFKVATCEGWAIPARPASRRGGNIGLTASVLDTAYAHREVKRYRSETKIGPPGHRFGRDGALRAAKAHAAWLNRQPDLA